MRASTTLALCAFAFLCSSPAAAALAAHSGGTDASGCHAGSQPYHCHNGGAAGSDRPQPTLTGYGPGDLDCADFYSWDEAQETLHEHLGDPNALDGDGDGIACEGLR